MAILSKSFKTQNADSIGAFASGLCLIHCLATPFIFMAQTCTASCCDNAPVWWQSIDYIFIGVSFFAVYWSVKTSSKKWITNALWLCWLLLSVVILNEKFQIVSLPEWMVYLPALALVGLHLYNRKYCQCANSQCCVNL